MEQKNQQPPTGTYVITQDSRVDAPCPGKCQPVGYVVYRETLPFQKQPDSDVPDYFWWSLLVCLCCAWPCGIGALIASHEAKTCNERGEHAVAMSNARWAFYLIVASVVFGLIGLACLGIRIALYYFKIEI